MRTKAIVKTKTIHCCTLGCLLALTACSSDIERRNVTPAYMDVTRIAEVTPGVLFEVPKTLADTRSIDLEGNACIDKIICFEDTRNGDHDYNDLILLIRTTKNGGNIKFQIKPIAQGATLSIGLGIEGVADDGTSTVNDEILISDTRATLFNGDPGFINTLPDQPFVDYPINSDYKINKGGNKKEICKVYFYIVVDGKKMYAAKENSPMDVEGRPYGIVLLNDDFQYPQELVNIENVYSGCKSWFDGTNTAYRFNTPTGSYIDVPFARMIEDFK
jgi:hypothetical protein